MKQKTVNIRWSTLLVEGMRSITRLMDHMTCGPGGSRINCCDQNNDGIAFTSWYTRQAEMSLKVD